MYTVSTYYVVIILLFFLWPSVSINGPAKVDFNNTAIRNGDHPDDPKMARHYCVLFSIIVTSRDG